MARRSLKVDGIVAASCGRRYTGAVLRVEREGRCVFERAYGACDDGPSAAIQRDSVFDLASLTKPFVATAALRAVASGALELDGSLATLFSGAPYQTAASCDFGKGQPTLRRLLAHTAGLQSGADYRMLLNDSIERYALGHEPAAPPGATVIYSDLGFIAVGVLLARVLGRSLASVIADTTAALGCTRSGFRPRNDGSGAVPATECDAWRGRVRGVVHDEKAYLMGGVAGHAGLFGTARDVARVADPFLAVAAGRAQSVLPRELARAAIVEQAPDPVLRRGLGWALRTSDENSCGTAMSYATFGHTGFTGTSVWADPERDLSVVFLTNAVYYGRNDLRDIRAAVCDAAVEDFATCAPSA